MMVSKGRRKKNGSGFGGIVSESEGPYIVSDEASEEAFAMARRRSVVDTRRGARPALVPAPLCSDVMPFRTMRAGIGVQRFVRALALAKPGIRDAWACAV